jgi:prepilin-type N-terminal cleavage/methylation domain
MFLKMMNKKKKGFTLIELIAVIAILGILIAIIAPRMMGYTDSAKVSKTKANVKTLITAIEVFNSTADTPSSSVLTTTTLDNIESGVTGHDADTLKGDANALQSLKDTATDIEADDAIYGTTTYAKLQAAMANSVDTYSEIETALK